MHLPVPLLLRQHAGLDFEGPDVHVLPRPGTRNPEPGTLSLEPSTLTPEPETLYCRYSPDQSSVIITVGADPTFQISDMVKFHPRACEAESSRGWQPPKPDTPTTEPRNPNPKPQTLDPKP